MNAAISKEYVDALEWLHEALVEWLSNPNPATITVLHKAANRATDARLAFYQTRKPAGQA